MIDELYEARDPHKMCDKPHIKVTTLIRCCHPHMMGDDPHKMRHLETVGDWAGGASRNILEKLQQVNILYVEAVCGVVKTTSEM